MTKARGILARYSANDFEPMEAESAASLPQGHEWQYEPKWDGFRCILTRDKDAVHLSSKRGEDLSRYFPEIVADARRLKPKSFILDGELVITRGHTLSFDSLLQRIHPAVSRVTKLSQETPALFIAFDILAQQARQLASQPLSVRRIALERFASHFKTTDHFRLSKTTRSRATAVKWLQYAGGGFDGVIAKRTDLDYRAGRRDGMVKVKRYRSADCVIGGLRYAEKPNGARKVIGSILLGLYDDQGALHHVGFSSAIKANERTALTKRLVALKTEQSFTGTVPGRPSRWSTRRSSEWIPLSPRLVVEVSYDHFTGGRFRHGTRIMRWRADKKPKQCTLAQLNQKAMDIRSLMFHESKNK